MANKEKEPYTQPVSFAVISATPRLDAPDFGDALVSAATALNVLGLVGRDGRGHLGHDNRGCRVGLGLGLGRAVHVGLRRRGHGALGRLVVLRRLRGSRD
jgi:hypothetical protein